MEELKDKIKFIRGNIRGLDAQIEQIGKMGIPELINECYSKKIGIKKIHDVAMLSKDMQREFVAWLNEEKRNKNQVDTKITKMYLEAKE